jgi:hypothetical protein
MSGDSVVTQVAIHNHRIAVHDITIEQLKKEIDSCKELITGIRIANARWNIASGALTAILIKGLEHFWH